MGQGIRIDRRHFDAVVLDMDGVVTDTARVHFRSWKEVFDDLLQERIPGSEPFRPEDYRRYVDGVSRYAGVRAFVAARGLDLPEGSPEDPPDARTVHGIGNRKNARFRKLLQEEGVEVFPEVPELLRRWRSRGMGLALVSASRNAGPVLEAAALADEFDVRVDGLDAERWELQGKPAPDLFLEAARRLGVDPGRAVVVEDSLAGVEAGAAAGFGLVVGMARRNHGEALMAHGAQVVVRSLEEIEAPEEPPHPRRAVSGRDLPSALDHFEEIVRWVRNRRPVVFLDFDGTLSPIVPDPGAARLAEGMDAVLQGLAACMPVAVVSGRDRDDVEARVPVPGIAVAGSHGLDIGGAGEGRIHPLAGPYGLVLAQVGDALEARLAGVPGARVERKHFSVAAHFRNVSPERVPEVEAAVAAVRDTLVPPEAPLRVTHGRKVLELRPAVDWDKGHAVAWLLEVMAGPDPDPAPIYLGDDVTDEDAFRALATSGLGILVGSPERPSAARYRLEDPGGVATFLTRLAEACGRAGRGDWLLTYDRWNPAEQPLREALCTLGNGRFATRGAVEEATSGGVHYPGTYLAGGYNRLKTHIAGRTVENEDLVNWPDWLPLGHRATDGPWFDLDAVEILDFRQILDLRSGVLHRRVRYRDVNGRITRLDARRLVSMADPHLAAIHLALTPEDWSGTLVVRAALDGTVRNAGVARYRDLASRHLEPMAAGPLRDDGIFLVVRSSQSHLVVAEAARIRVGGPDGGLPVRRFRVQEPGYIAQDIEIPVEAGRVVWVEKVVALTSSRDFASSEPRQAACQAVSRAPGFVALLEDHAQAWDRLWNRCDLDLEGEAATRRNTRLHVFHLLQTVSPNSVDRDVGVPARGWHGEAYRGHVFWDELFVLPFLNLRFPELSRSLLDYRVRRLPEARQLAREAGFRGAMYPWQSGSDGREESQVLHLNPNSGRWVPDHTRLQRHVALAVAWNVWQYVQATGDEDFLVFHGAAVFLEVARFAASLASWDPGYGRWRIRGVMGPDEYHDAYPWADEPGLDDNAYTNVMAAWVLRTAAALLGRLPETPRQEIMEQLSLSREERERWSDVAHGLRVALLPDGLIAQFDRYDELEELDWDAYRARYGDIRRLDRILEAEGDSVNRYKAAKQADVLMLLYLFSTDELREVLGGLGLELRPDDVRRTVQYYMARTSHGSSLSRVVHSWVLSRSDRERSWRYFLEALRGDVDGDPASTTHEGIHLGAMAGTLDLVQRCFVGLELRGDVLWLNPVLPEALPRLSFPLRFQGHRLDLEVRPGQLEVRFSRGPRPEVRVGVRGEVHTFREGDRRILDI